MKSVRIGSVVLAGLLVAVSFAFTQPPPDRGPRDKKDGPPPGGPPRFELGRVLPPPLVEELELTEKQRADIAKLEKEVKERLAKILTAEQKKKVENFRPRFPGRPGGPPGAGPDRPRRGGADDDKSGRPKRPEPPDRPDKS
jgi:hypothetical protein